MSTERCVLLAHHINITLIKFVPKQFSAPPPVIPTQPTFGAAVPFAPRPQPSAFSSTPILQQNFVDEDEPEVIRCAFPQKHDLHELIDDLSTEHGAKSRRQTLRNVTRSLLHAVKRPYRRHSTPLTSSMSSTTRKRRRILCRISACFFCKFDYVIWTLVMHDAMPII